MPDFKTLRRASGHTQQALADKSGVSLRTIKYIEAGQRITVDSAVKLSPLLDVPILTLLLEVNQ